MVGVRQKDGGRKLKVWDWYQRDHSWNGGKLHSYLREMREGVVGNETVGSTCLKVSQLEGQ